MSTLSEAGTRPSSSIRAVISSIADVSSSTVLACMLKLFVIWLAVRSRSSSSSWKRSLDR